MNRKEIAEAQAVIDSVTTGSGNLEPLTAAFPKENTMQPYQERVITEMKELDEKIVKLDTFRHSPIYDTLPEAERDRLTRQYAHMKDYSNVLAERISAF
jgi:hypothetical protein